MRLNRFFYDFDETKLKILIQDKSIIHQIRKVLRLKPGKKIILFNKNQKEALVKILNFNNEMILVEALSIYEVNSEPPKEINLYMGILKKENFELVCQKATEIGISNICPLLTDYTIKLNLNYERLKRIIKEAAEQSGRSKIPNLLEIEKFNNLILKINKNDLNLFFDPSGQNFKKFLNLISQNKKINIFIGPEGGWSTQEINLAIQNDFKIIKLSNLIFRAETAAIITSYLTLNF